jgi:chromosome segregation ATPase
VRDLSSPSLSRRNLAAKVCSLQADLEISHSLANSLQEELTRANMDVSTLQNELDHSVKTLEDKLSAAEKDGLSLVGELEVSRGHAQSVKDDLEKSRRENQSLAGELEASRGYAQSVKDDLEKSRRENQYLVGELEESNRLSKSNLEKAKQDNLSLATELKASHSHAKSVQDRL